MYMPNWAQSAGGVWGYFCLCWLSDQEHSFHLTLTSSQWTLLNFQIVQLMQLNWALSSLALTNSIAGQRPIEDCLKMYKSSAIKNIIRSLFASPENLFKNHGCAQQRRAPSVSQCWPNDPIANTKTSRDGGTQLRTRSCTASQWKFPGKKIRTVC